MNTGASWNSVALMGILVLAGCSGGGDTCVPGAMSACVCATGSSGAQACLSDGTFGQCVCESSEPDAGTPPKTYAQGTVGGRSVTLVSAAFGTSSDNSLVRILLTSEPDTCSWVSSFNRANPTPPPAGFQLMALSLLDTTGPIVERLYPITTFVEPQPKTTADATLFGPGENDRASALSGTVKVSGLSSSSIKGTFRMDVGGATVEGAFNGPLCPGVWNF